MFPTYNRRKVNRQQIMRAVNDIREVIRNPESGTQNRVLHAAKELQTALRGISRQLDSNLAEVVRFADQIIRTQNAGWVAGMANAMEGSGHPIGQLLASQMRAKRNAKLNADMETRLKSTAAILQQISPELFGDGKPVEPEKAGGRRVQDEPPSIIQDGKPLPQGVEYLGNGFVKVKGPGLLRFYKETDPIITGKPIKVSSSNVHSISYRLNPKDPSSGLLFVRYLQADGGYNGGPASQVKVAGPTYGYKGVHPDLFTAFKKAISKGIFVWDNLRQRGTIEGSQYPYFLARIAQMYMPRRAVREGKNVWFRGRKNIAILNNGRIRSVRSQLPDQIARRARTRRTNPRPPSRKR